MMVDTKKEVSTIYFYGIIKGKRRERKWEDKEEERIRVTARKKACIGIKEFIGRDVDVIATRKRDIQCTNTQMDKAIS